MSDTRNTAPARGHAAHIGPLAWIVLLTVLAACSPKRPVLYPNPHYKAVGAASAQRDIDECVQMATTAGAGQDPSTAAARQGASGAAVGGAAGGAWGLVRGNAGQTAAAGAAVGGATGLVRGALKSDDRGPVYRRFVERCLRERGYDPIGWQ